MRRTFWLFLSLCHAIVCRAEEGVFEGTIGKNLKITMQLDRSNGKVSGTYHYEKNKAALTVSGDLRPDGEAELQEFLGKKKTGTFKGRFNTDRDAFTGTWISPDGRRHLPFAVSERKPVRKDRVDETKWTRFESKGLKIRFSYSVHENFKKPRVAGDSILFEDREWKPAEKDDDIEEEKVLLRVTIAKSTFEEAAKAADFEFRKESEELETRTLPPGWYLPSRAIDEPADEFLVNGRKAILGESMYGTHFKGGGYAGAVEYAVGVLDGPKGKVATIVGHGRVDSDEIRRLMKSFEWLE